MTAIETYNQAVSGAPAYKEFLQEKLGSIPDVKSIRDFEKLPFMNKADYVLKYPVESLCVGGDVTCAHIWLRSSGTSRKPFFWPRRIEDEKNMPAGMQRLFKSYVSPEVQPTLIVVGLALGPWGTGTQSSYIFRSLAGQTPGLAVVTPGLQIETIIEVFERISPHYRQTLLLSYPPFAKMALEQALERGIDLKALNLKLMVGGEGISEYYRDRMWGLIGKTEKDIDSVWCLYGSTDFANVGFESALSIAARRIIFKNNLAGDVFGEPDLPMLFHRVPSDTYFEVVDGELVVTRMQGIPLIRYRTGDHVIFMERDELLARLRKAGFDAEQAVRDCGVDVPEFKTPFVALYGRIDQAVYFYGAKMTLDQVKTALETPAMSEYFNGRFLVRGRESKKGDPQIEITLEKSETLDKSDLDEVAEIFSKQFEKVQSEFREVRSLAKGRRHVVIKTAGPEVFELGWKTRHM